MKLRRTKKLCHFRATLYIYFLRRTIYKFEVTLCQTVARGFGL